MKRFGLDRIEVSPNTPQNCWPVSKCIVLQDVRDPRKSNKPAGTVFYIPDPRKRQLGDRIFFNGTSRKSPADILNLDEVRKDAEESKLLNSGYVVMNDPFQQNMFLSTGAQTTSGSSTMNKFVQRPGLTQTRGSVQSLIRSPQMSNHRGKKESSRNRCRTRTHYKFS